MATHGRRSVRSSVRACDGEGMFRYLGLSVPGLLAVSALTPLRCSSASIKACVPLRP